MEYATRDFLKKSLSGLPLTEQLSMESLAKSINPDGSTFLSHSSKDGELLGGAILLLKTHGATVYVDKKDPELPPYTNKETAAGLKSRIHQSKKFVLLASENSKDSRWVPWELGIADGYKGLSRVAVLPAVESQHKAAWADWEYLGLYDRIVWGNLQGESEKVWMVLDARAKTATKLSVWLATS